MLSLLTGITIITAVGMSERARAAQPEPSPGQEMGPGMMQRTEPGQTRPGGMMGPGGTMGGGIGMIGRMAPQGPPWLTIMLDHRQELGLSAEQVGTLFDLRERFQDVAQEKTQAIARAEAELNEMLGPEPVDLAAAEAKIKQIEALRTELQVARLKTIEEGKQLLTPEQRTKLVQTANRLGPASGSGPMGHGGRP